MRRYRTSNRVLAIFIFIIAIFAGFEKFSVGSNVNLTAGLLAAVPSIDSTIERLHAIDGSPPSLSARPSGCQFHPRCAFALPVCAERDPDFQWFDGSMVACHRAAEDLPMAGGAHAG